MISDFAAKLRVSKKYDPVRFAYVVWPDQSACSCCHFFVFVLVLLHPIARRRLEGLGSCQCPNQCHPMKFTHVSFGGIGPVITDGALRSGGGVEHFQGWKVTRQVSGYVI